MYSFQKNMKLKAQKNVHPNGWEWWCTTTVNEKWN